MTGLQKGILCVLGVTLCFASMDTSVRAMTSVYGYDAFFVVWARYAGQAVGVAVIFLPRITRIVRTERLALQIVRSALLFAATLCFFTSLAFLPVANMTAIAQVAPLAITALAALVLSEKVGVYRWGAVIVGFVGALIIVRPGFGDTGWASLLALIGAFAFAAFSVSTRFLGSRESVWTTFFYTAIVGAVIASLLVPFHWQTPREEDIPMLLLISLLGATGQALLIFAMTFAAASLLAPFLYVQLIWATTLGFVVFGETPDIWVVVGGTIIVAAGLFVRWRERVRVAQDP